MYPRARARPPFFYLPPPCLKGIMTVVQAHVTLAALLRSDMRLPGVDSSDGEWPLQAKRLAKLAWAFAYRVRKAGGAAGASCLADDDVMVLCQGAEVLGAAMECADDFFEGSVKCEFLFRRRGGRRVLPLELGCVGEKSSVLSACCGGRCGAL